MCFCYGGLNKYNKISMRKLLFTACLVGLATLRGIAETVPETDTIKKSNIFRKIYHYFEDSNEDKTGEKKIDFSIIGGPHYSSDVGFGIGWVAAGLYRVDKTDFTIPPSNVTLFGDVATSGFFLLGIRGNTLFEGGRFRVDFTSYFYSLPSDFWGIGYDAGRYAEKSTYKRHQAQVKFDFMYRFLQNTYAGVNVSYNYIAGKKFTRPEYLGGQERINNNIGAGIFLMYDSRDYITNPSRGAFIKLEQRAFPEFLGNEGTFHRTEFTASTYLKIWKGAILAYDLHGMFNTGSVPWTMLSMMGGSSRMRGYYDGRYRDRNLVETQLELRQKVYNRHGFVVWGGAGNVFPKWGKFDWSHTLPTYGLGYRWEFKNRVNVRLDYGFGKNTSGFIFNINEAF